MNNRARGHNYERKLASIFREIGWALCKTTRQTSRLLDACKIDLSGIPFLVQAKKVQANIKYDIIFQEMEDNLTKEGYADLLDLPKLIFHSKGKGKYDSVVVIPEKEFFAFIQKVQDKLNNDRIVR